MFFCLDMTKDFYQVQVSKLWYRQHIDPLKNTCFQCHDRIVAHFRSIVILFQLVYFDNANSYFTNVLFCSQLIIIKVCCLNAN